MSRGAWGAGAVVGTVGVAAWHERYRERRYAAVIDRAVERDLHSIHAGQALAPAPVRGRPHRERGILRCYLKGTLIGTVGTFVLTAIGSAALAVAMGENPYQSSLLALLVWPLGTFLGLAVLGSIIWTREVRARLREQVRTDAEQYEQTRHEVADWLAGGGDIGYATARLESWHSRIAAVVLPPHPDQQVTVQQPPPPAAAPLPDLGTPVRPIEVLAVSAAVVRAVGGYVRKEEGPRSTPACVVRVLTEAGSPERRQCEITHDDLAEARAALGWVLAGHQADDYRGKVAPLAALESLDPRAEREIGLLASAVGAYRRSLAL